MILDKKFSGTRLITDWYFEIHVLIYMWRQVYFFIYDIASTGILDQGEGVLIVFDETPVDKTYESALETIQSMGKVVDSLYDKTKKLH